MAKDPAFLFYSSDFLTGTMVMSDAEVGQYIRLLCFQHQHGHFDAMAMQRLCNGNATASVAAKFITDEKGLFFNERLEKEVIKRQLHSEKQRQNANKRWQCDGNAKGMPLENENEIENRNESINENKKGVRGKKNEAEAAEIIQYLNDIAGKSFKTDNKAFVAAIQARMVESTAERLREVVELKTVQWKEDAKMEKYLIPSTLFSKSNFWKYVGEVDDAKARGLTKEQIKGAKKGINEGLAEGVAAIYRARAERERSDNLRAANAKES